METNNEVEQHCDDRNMELEQEISSREGFTSEIFKIELNGLPKYFGVGQAKKLLKKQKINFHKLKPCGKGATYMFINFKNEEDREKAIAILDGLHFKGKKLKAFKAKAAKDPMLKTREKNQVEDTRPIKEQICAAVCPLYNLTYDEQIAEKQKEIDELLVKIREDTLSNLKGDSVLQHIKEEHQLAVLEEIVQSPVINGYRNKCEFSVGHHPETNDITVGFRLASYKKGSIAVVGVQDLPIVSDKMKEVVLSFQQFCRDSGYQPFNNVSQKGNWKQLTVRTTRNENVMALVILNPKGLDDEEKENLKSSLRSHMKNSSLEISALYIQFFDRKNKGEPDAPMELLDGSPFITEKLFDLEFKISPKAFFQINTLGAELLYQKVGDLAKLDQDSTLLDVCCGTGTIGLCLARRCGKVIGVEIVEEAVKDAKENARKNEVINAEFIAGPAEVHLARMLKSAKDPEKTVAIVDPPRAGLHPKAIQALRSSRIQKLIYVSCDAKAAKNNFLSLSRPTSNAFPGKPFLPKKAVAVDLFPHTKHFELILLFERV